MENPLRSSPLQFGIRWLMILVAVIALLLAYLGFENAMAASALALTGSLPVLRSSPDRRWEAALWSGAIYPVLTLPCLYATWAAAWCVLQHRPQTYVDDPRSIGEPLFVVPHAMTSLSLTIGWPLAAASGIGLLVLGYRRRRILRELLILSSVWLAVLGCLRWDPLGVGAWFVD